MPKKYCYSDIVHDLAKTGKKIVLYGGDIHNELKPIETQTNQQILVTGEKITDEDLTAREYGIALRKEFGKERYLTIDLCTPEQDPEGRFEKYRSYIPKSGCKLVSGMGNVDYTLIFP